MVAAAARSPRPVTTASSSWSRCASRGPRPSARPGAARCAPPAPPAAPTAPAWRAVTTSRRRPCDRKRASAADERQPRRALEPLPAGHGDDANHAGRGTCVPPHAERSKSVDLDQPELAGPRRLLAQRQRRGLLLGARTGRVTGRSSHTTRLASASASCDLARRHFARQIDRRRVGAEVETHRPHAEAADRTRPTARAARCAAACDRTGAASRSRRARVAPRRSRASTTWRDLAVLIVDRRRAHARAAELARVEGLAAGRRDRTPSDRARPRTRARAGARRPARTTTHGRLELAESSSRCSRVRSVTVGRRLVPTTGTAKKNSAPPSAPRR